MTSARCGGSTECGEVGVHACEACTTLCLDEAVRYCQWHYRRRFNLCLNCNANRRLNTIFKREGQNGEWLCNCGGCRA